MDQLIDFLMTTDYAQYVFAWCLLCRAFVTVAPVKWTEKINDYIMLFISACALSANKTADNKGNKIT